MHSLQETGIVAIFALLAGIGAWRRRFSSAMAAVGLVMSSAGADALLAANEREDG